MKTPRSLPRDLQHQTKKILEKNKSEFSWLSARAKISAKIKTEALIQFTNVRKCVVSAFSKFLI